MEALTLEQAKKILAKHTTEAHLFTHAAAVSAAMGAMADHFGAGMGLEPTRLLHPTRFPGELLEPEGVPEEDIRAIISHGYGITTEEAKPETDMEKSLFAVDELTGIVQAYALMRPEGLDGMAVKSLKKKFKDKRFAAKCSREIIKQGFAMLGMEAGEVMQCCIDGMQAHKEELGF